MSSDKPTLEDLRIDRTQTRRTKTPWLLLLVLAFVGLVAGGAVWWMNRPKPVPVRTAVVVQPGSAGGERTLLNASGYVTARRKSTVSAKVTGKVTEILVEEGMKVEVGQVLARLDSSNVEKSLQLAEAQADSARKTLDETKANLNKAERELKRIAQLAAEKVSSPSDLDNAEAEAKSLQARLDRQLADVAVAEREIALWKQQFDDTIVRAPFSGIVTTKDAQPGEMISPMSAGGFTRTGICTIVDMTSLEIEVDVNESYINRVSSGQPVEGTLDAYPEWQIPCKVIAIIPTADRQKATVKVRVGFVKLDPRILPDMSAKVAFRASGEVKTTERKLTVPRAAVRQRDGRDTVFLVQNGRVEQRAVTLGGAQGDDVTIAAGLSGGERLVVDAPVD
ncbi:MAG TPA: efflux RND transporter periplasmic adaptor subunit, partial [Candidatus Binatia bacterium]|nr:efflux RND transporter periplasmic adaptor subunit [Candidatus Binatia bacterium]